MTETVLNWTAEDAMREWCRVNPGCDAHPRGSGAYPPSLYALDYARAVERAVLDRVALQGGRYAVVQDGRYVESVSRVALFPEAECRTREREAFCAGWNVRNRNGDKGANLDNLYPSLLPKTPPPLKLSTGEWTRNESGTWWRRNQTAYADTPKCATAADADALAAWLRKHGER